MSTLSAQSVRRLCQMGMVQPYHPRTKLHGRSYGLSCCGYDIRLKQGMWLWPFWMRLGSTVERFSIPTNVKAEVKDKSTNIRKGICVFNTVIEPGWRGDELTLELLRVKPWPIYLKPGTPIAQVVFEWLDEPTELPYPEDGKYQNQRAGPVAAIME